MKRLSALLTKMIACILLVVMTFSLVACGKDDDNSSSSSSSSSVSTSSSDSGSSSSVQDLITISLSIDKDTIRMGETAQLTVDLQNSNKGYYIETQSNLVSISDSGVVSIVKNITTQRTVNITAFAKEDNNVKSTVRLSLLPAIQTGEIGELTSEMIAEIGNSNITVNAKVVDYYQDFVDASYNSSTEYRSVVKMDNELWYGSWTSVKEYDSEGNAVLGEWDSALYGKGDTDVTTYDSAADQMVSGKPVETYYINKNNEYASKIVTTGDSYPVLWGDMHYWNHLGELVISNFEPVSSAELGDHFAYKIDPTQMDPDAVDGLWLPTYLVYSLTPMVADTFHSLAVFIDGEKITKIVGTTEYLYWLEGEITTANEAEYLTYTEIEITFEDIGTTEIPMPAPYKAVNDEKNQLLKEALAKMQNLNNYTFSIVDNQTSAPSYDSGDYEMMSVTQTGSAMASTNPFQGNTATGTVGKVGKVTEAGVFIEETGKYSYGMDDKLYHHTYYGYKQVDAGHYDYFELDGGFLKGKKQYAGSFLKELPSFNFASELFAPAGEVWNNDYSKLLGYRYRLVDSNITKEIGMETVFGDGSYGAASTHTVATLIVDPDTKYITSIEIPYDISYGTYSGTYKVTFSKFGSTTISDSVWDGYEQRVVPQTWDQLPMKYYRSSHSTLAPDEDIDTESVIKEVWGCESSVAIGMPQPGALIEIFEDRMNGPFYDWSTGEDENGNTVVTKKWFGVNFALPSYVLDENSVIIQEYFDYYMDAVHEYMISLGYSVDMSNTDLSGGRTGRLDRYITYVNDNVKVVIENNFTRFIDFDFYVI